MNRIAAFLSLTISLFITIQASGQKNSISTKTLKMEEVIAIIDSASNSIRFENCTIIYPDFVPDYELKTGVMYTVESYTFKNLNWSHLSSVAFVNCLFKYPVDQVFTYISLDSLRANRLNFFSCSAFTERSSDAFNTFNLDSVLQLNIKNSEIKDLGFDKAESTLSIELSNTTLGDFGIMACPKVDRIHFQNIHFLDSDTNYAKVHGSNKEASFVQHGAIRIIKSNCNKVILDEVHSTHKSQGCFETWYTNIENLSIKNSRLNAITLGNESSPFASFEEIGTIYMEKDRIGTFKLANITIAQSATFREVKLNQLNLFQSILPWPNLNLAWSDLGIDQLVLNKFSTKPDSINDINNIITAAEWDYSNYTSQYKKWIQNYSDRGDRSSENACLVDFMDLETLRLEERYRQAGGFDLWFRWRFNQFMKSFSGYGTNPISALYFSFKIVLLFAGIYFLLPKYWKGEKDLSFRDMIFNSLEVFQDRYSLVAAV